MTDPYLHLQPERYDSGASPGSPLQAVVGPDRLPLGPRPKRSVKDTASLILGAYLKKIVFAAERGGDPNWEHSFRLNEVFTRWPDPSTELPYPCASVDDTGVIPIEAHNLVPTMLEETVDCYGEGLVLWKTGEYVADFQVDFWTNSAPHREAILAGIPRAFSPTEERAGVLLQGIPDYYDRPLRALLTDVEYVDESNLVFERERRLRTIIRCEIDVVHLRAVNPLNPRYAVEVTDT